MLRLKARRETIEQKRKGISLSAYWEVEASLSLGYIFFALPDYVVQ